MLRPLFNASLMQCNCQRQALKPSFESHLGSCCVKACWASWSQDVGVNSVFSPLLKVWMLFFWSLFYFYFLNVFFISQLCYNTTIKLRDFQLKKKVNKNSFQNVIKNIHFFSHFNCVAGNQSEVFIRNLLFLIFVWFHSEGINKQPEDTVLHESISKTPTQHIWKGHVFEISGWVMFHRVS